MHAHLSSPQSPYSDGHGWGLGLLWLCKQLSTLDHIPWGCRVHMATVVHKLSLVLKRGVKGWLAIHPHPANPISPMHYLNSEEKVGRGDYYDICGVSDWF